MIHGAGETFGRHGNCLQSFAWKCKGSM